MALDQRTMHIGIGEAVSSAIPSWLVGEEGSVAKGVSCTWPSAWPIARPRPSKRERRFALLCLLADPE